MIIKSFFEPSSRWYYPLRWLVIIFLGSIIYAQTFGFGFVFDDNLFIVNNHCITKFDNVQYVWRMFPPTRTIGFYTLALNYSLGQLNPQGYHIFNFLVHLAAVGLVWALASILFKSAGEASQELPFFIALLFLVHPCQTQAVSYVSQRFESMATLFYLSSVYLYFRGRTASLKSEQLTFFAASGATAFLGILTKETAVTIPLTLLAAELIFFTKKGVSRKNAYALIISGGIFFLLFMKLVRTDLDIFFNFPPIASQSHDGDMITVPKYLLTQMHVFLSFMRLMVFPVLQNCDYDYPVSKGLLAPPWTLLGLVLSGTMVFSIFKFRRKFPLIAFGLAWILITFSINLAPRANVIFEHKLYLISFGFFLALAGFLSVIIQRKKLLLALLTGLIMIFSLMSVLRNQVWKNEFSLWSDVVQKSPKKARPYYNLGIVYYMTGDLTSSNNEYSKAIGIDPGYIDAYVNRGINYDQEGDLLKAKADFDKAIALDPDLSEAYYNLGDLLMKSNQLKEALSAYNKAIEKNPDYALAYSNCGSIYLRAGELHQAVSAYDKAIGINQNFAAAYFDRAIAYYQLKDYNRALGDLYKAQELGYAVSPAMLADFRNHEEFAETTQISS